MRVLLILAAAMGGAIGTFVACALHLAKKENE